MEALGKTASGEECRPLGFSDTARSVEPQHNGRLQRMWIFQLRLAGGRIKKKLLYILRMVEMVEFNGAGIRCLALPR